MMNKEINKQKKRYWLRGGVVAVIINLFLFLIDYLLGFHNTGDMPSLLIIFSFLIADVVYWGKNTFFAIIVTSSVVLFIIGALIGFIYGKNKVISK